MTDTDDSKSKTDSNPDDDSTTEGGDALEPITDRLDPGRVAAAADDVDVRRAASTLLTVVLVLAVVPFVVYAVPGVVGASESYVVLSGSMEPTISPGDVIVVEDVDPGDVEEGDVITFRRDGDRLAENWIFIDHLHVLHQLGHDALADGARCEKLCDASGFHGCSLLIAAGRPTGRGS